ncbi:hypothetical protein [Chitinolyticbacter meiyuanensis]|uniref:hypothetical protein n=1 Tax=Chitinolyticbacter meiyuanensis TaxID=682798 RepID=UPI0011E5C5D8|nr:hypothetical protein [Chitinolyticbacter meiyuanensis]
MSMHKVPLTAVEEEGLRAHRLPVGEPSQLSDAFRHGVAWAQKAAIVASVPGAVGQIVPTELSDEIIQAARWSGAGDVSINETWAVRELWKRLLFVIREQAHEPHPPTRHCMCAHCAPSFDDSAVPPATSSDAPEIPDWGELRRLASVAEPIFTDLYGDRYFGDSPYSRADLSKEQDAFFTAVSPATVIALLDRLAELNRQWQALREVDRKDAARYRWLLANYARGDGYTAIDRALNDGDADTQLSPAIDAAIAQEQGK